MQQIPADPAPPPAETCWVCGTARFEHHALHGFIPVDDSLLIVVGDVAPMIADLGGPA